MPASKALRLCPEAVVIPPDGAEYRRMSGLVMDLIRHHVPSVEAAGLDEAYADLTGMVAPSAAMRRVVRDIQVETGLHASVGIGPNKLVAKVASDADKPDGFVVLSSTQAALRFADEPCRLIPGIGPKTAERLERMGVVTVQDLADAAEANLIEAFGTRQGPWLAKRARFEDDAPIQTSREAVSESREETFDEDISDVEEMRARMGELVGELSRALRKHGHKGRTVGIKVRYSDFETHTRARTVPAPIDDAENIGRIAGELLDEFNPERAVRLLGVRVAGLAERPAAEQLGQLKLPIS
jgi:DNA polymerase-4